MDRALAYALDIFICEILFLVIDACFLGLLGTQGQSLYGVGDLLFRLIYTFIADYYFDGITFGKKIVGIRTVLLADNKLIYCLTHGILRGVFALFGPLTLWFYTYVDAGRVPYDLWFDTSVENVKRI